MYRIILMVDAPRKANIIGIKEVLAMQLEKYGDVRFTSVKWCGKLPAEWTPSNKNRPPGGPTSLMGWRRPERRYLDGPRPGNSPRRNRLLGGAGVRLLCAVTGPK